MGRGDRRTKKGKIAAGSFGNARPARTASAAVTADKSAEPKKATKKAPVKKKAAK